MRDMSITTSDATRPAPATSMPAGVGIGWRPEIADVLAAQPGLTWVEVVAESVLVREATRLRKRYEVAKQKLREMAVAEGLVSAQEG